MKKAEAISILATSVRPREAKDRARYDEAVRMAIEALKCSETPKSSERTSETAQPEKQHGRIFQEIVVKYPSYNPHPERKGKPYFSIKYTENGQEFIGYSTYKPEVLSEYLKEYFMPSAQPERKKPVFKTGESVYHVSYADGTGGFKKNKWADWTCPDCGWFVGEQYIPRRHNQQKCNYCAKCGCAIDWSDADMRGEQDG